MNVDIDETKKYYYSMNELQLCDCEYCKNYYIKISKKYKSIADYLSHLGIDIAKPFELSFLEADEKGILEYINCQYIAFGDCEDSFYHKIGDVEFFLSKFYPNTNIKKPHFVLEFSPIFLDI